MSPPRRGGRGRRGGRRRGGKGRRGPPRRRGPSVRKLAAGIVRGVLEGRGAARTHLERAAERDDLDGRALGLLTELVYGTLRRATTIDHLLALKVKQGLSKVEDDVLSQLQVGTYELLFLDRVHPAVTVSEAVEAVGRPQVRGFVNGVLRALGRAIEGPADEPPAGVPSSRLLPGRESGWVVLREDLLPRREDHPARWLAVAGSLPQPLVARWIERLGEAGALELVRAQNAPPPVCLRVNPLRGDREALLEALEAAEVKATPGEVPGSILLGASLGEGGHEALWAGTATVQDLTAMQVAPFVDPQPGERVLDLCAAPGGKTTHLAELMRDEGAVWATDIEQDRLDRVDSAVSRLGLTSVQTHLADPADPRPGDEVDFDRVLVDVPCSNTGVMRRRVELRHRLDALDTGELHTLQDRLLRRAVELVKPGGVVVYSTCSIEPDENQDRVQALLAERDDLSLDAERVTLPSVGGGDGGYVARIRRAAT